MENFRLIVAFFVVVVSFGVYCCPNARAAVVNKQRNDINSPVSNHADEKETDSNSNNDIESNRELLNVARVQDSNFTDDYIGGDAFNLEFAAIFKEYVDQQGLVNYSKLRRYRNQLNHIVEKLADLKPEVYITWSRNEKIAFWINAYNICTLKGVIDNYPINPSRFMLLFYPANSVMHIRGLRDVTYFTIMGIQYTLDEIEKDILLARFEEPAICFAVNYGTMGSAPLRNEPYMGKLLDKQFDKQIRSYFLFPDAFRINEANKVVYISPIFKMYQWRQDAFLKRYGTNKLFRDRDPVDRAILNFIKDYVSDANAEFLKRREYSIEYIKYNWQLNEQPQSKD